MQLYCLTFPNGKKYIGITSKTAQERFKRHCDNSSKSIISRAVRKYGKDSVIMSVIAECDNWELLCLAEQEAIEKFNTIAPNGYNLTLGGEGLYGHAFSDKHREKISINIRKRLELDKDFLKRARDKIRKGKDHPRYGIPREQSIKDKISKTLTGLTASQETKNKMSVVGRKRNNNPLSGMKGVTKNHNKWIARARFNRQTKHIGSFSTAEEASAAYQNFVADLTDTQ